MVVQGEQAKEMIESEVSNLENNDYSDVVCTTSESVSSYASIAAVFVVGGCIAFACYLSDHLDWALMFGAIFALICLIMLGKRSEYSRQGTLQEYLPMNNEYIEYDCTSLDIEQNISRTHVP
jgi:hypothetical protein